MYFNYHAKIKKRLDNGEFVKWEIVKQYHGISPCMLIFFRDGTFSPVREHKFDEYLRMFGEIEKRCYNKTMSNEIEIKIIHGTMLCTNNYVVSKGEHAVLIDASGDIFEIEKALDGKTLDAVLLTHGHWDHYLKIDEILTKFGVKCYLTKEEHFKIRHNKERTYCNKPIETALGEEWFCEICDGETLVFHNLQIGVLKTPGHTNGSVCFLLDDIMFSGDTLFCGTYGRCDFPTGSEADMRKSLKKLSELNEKTKVFPGHGDATTIACEKNGVLKEFVSNE